jgi:hypothetical protein
MAEHLTITTSHRGDILKPLIEAALEREKRTLALAITRTRERLSEFEARFNISTAEFERRLLTLELTETPELSEWRMEVGMLRLLEDQHQALQEASLD